MSHALRAALPVRPAVLAVIAFHAGLVLLMLLNLGRVEQPLIDPPITLVDITERTPKTHPEPEHLRATDPERIRIDVTPPVFTQDTTSDRIITERQDPPVQRDPVEAAGSMIWTKPVVLVRTEIPYPGGRNAEGTVRLKLLIGVDGRPLQVLVGSTSGYPELDRAAVRSVTHWRFKPRLLNGAPVEAWAEMPIVFRLEN